MTLAAVISKEAFDALGEGMQAEYKVQVDGALKDFFMLDVGAVKGFSLDDTAGLKSALASERKAAADAKTALKVFDGIDVAKARDALGKLDEIDKWDPDKKLEQHKVDFEQKIQTKYEGEAKTAVTKLTTDLDTERGRSKAMMDTLSGALIDNAAIRALEQNGGSVDLLLPHVKGRARINEQDGKFSVEVLGDDGLARLSPQSGNTGPMSVAELVAEMKGSDKFAAGFGGSGASGSGASSDATRGGGSGGAPGTHTIAATDAKVPAKYRAAKEAATKAGVELQIVN